MATHTYSKLARRERDRRNYLEVAQYMRLLRRIDPERFSGGRQMEIHDKNVIAQRADRVEYYQKRAMSGLPLFDGAPWQRITTRQ